MSKTQKNGKLEFLRFLFSIAVMLRHSHYFLSNQNEPKIVTGGGAFAVEFFFILSGCLMMHSIQKLSTPPEDLGLETAGFLKKKVAGFLPEMLIAWGIGLLVTAIAQKLSLFGTIQYAKRNSLELLLMTTVGLHENIMNAPTWYLSSMVLVMVILYPLLRKYKSMMLRIVLPLGIAISLGYLMRTSDHLRGPLKWIGFTTKGTVRAFAEISLGVLIYPAGKKLSSLSLTTLGKILVTAAETLLYLLILAYMNFVPYGKSDFLYLLLFSIAIMLTFSGQGLDQNYFNTPPLFLPGKIQPVHLSVPLRLFLANFCPVPRIERSMGNGALFPSDLPYRCGGHASVRTSAQKLEPDSEVLEGLAYLRLVLPNHTLGVIHERTITQI